LAVLSTRSRDRWTHRTTRSATVSCTGLSRDAVALLVAKHANAARRTCPSLAAKEITPHVLRHTCAMQLLAAGVDITVIAL
jgi:site-specific recombinase XerD